MSGIKTDMMKHWFLYEKDLSSLLTCQQVTVRGGEHQWSQPGLQQGQEV